MAERISRKALLTAAGVATGGVIAAAVLGSRERPRAELADRITARRIDGEVPALDPRDERWLDSTPVLVPLVPQQIALPRLDELGVAEVEVAALHNGDELGLRVIWDDQVVDEVDGLGQFRDALAVQLPALRSGEPPPITMGAPGTPVHILQWRATWERDIDDRAEVEDVYPYAVHDVPPDDILPPEQAILYYPGRAAGNPLSELDRRTSIEEIVAEGFGSVTVVPEQHARGFGVRDGDRWMVAVGLRLVRGASGDTLVPGSVWPVSFAVWLGDRGNRGSRKQYADWVELELEG